MADTDHEAHQRAAVEIDTGAIRCSGAWTVLQLGAMEERLGHVHFAPNTLVRLDLAGLEKLDTAGAWLLHRTLHRLRGAGHPVTMHGASAETETLLELVDRTGGEPRPAPHPPHAGLLERIGRRTVDNFQNYFDFLAFIGEIAFIAAPLLLNPLRIRWRITLRNLAEAGYMALPIVGLLSFLLGIVIAYQGGVQLRRYGASLYIVDLVGLSTLRELAPLITAIIVAGRTGSAYTAQIGTMQVTEEVDALRTIGIAPVELLVVPKLLALLVALPLLTVYADIMGVFGGMFMSSTMLGVGFGTFVDRFSTAVSLDTFVIGVGKAPVFAAIIVTVGCFQGFRVGGNAESVGRQTTVSVVQSIFLVIVVDAAFSVAFSWLGI